ncbi:MAG: hypothetical protein AAGA83_11620, partial [Cyanobacteria bacterium P01_F01_bin.116]
ENMFSEDLVLPFVTKVVKRKGNEEEVVKSEINDSDKARFADFILSESTTDDFAKFECIKTKLDSVRVTE